MQLRKAYAGRLLAKAPLALRGVATTAVLVSVLSACGGGDGMGGDCEPCRSASPRCDSGLNCSGFSQFGIGKATTFLCAKPSTNSCPVS